MRLNPISENIPIKKKAFSKKIDLVQRKEDNDHDNTEKLKCRKICFIHCSQKIYTLDKPYT